jgi:competence protein ComGC
MSLPGGGSKLKRILLVLAALLLLVIILSAVKSALFTNPNGPAFLSVVQDQQELLHLSNNALQQQQAAQGAVSLSAASQNFASTTQVSITSAEKSLLTYMSQQHMKADPKKINLKVSSAVDAQLTAAANAGTYDQTYQQIMQSEMATYQNDLGHAYNLTKGPNGRQLLSNEYKYAKLLLQQLSSPA